MSEFISLESSLEQMEKRAASAEAAAKKLLSTVVAAKKAAQVGDLATLRRLLGDVGKIADGAQLEVEGLPSSWPVDSPGEQALFEDGSYVRELLQEAEQQGLAILEEDEQLLCYPSLIRLDPARRAVLIDRKPHRHVRPRVLVNHLKSQQERQTKFRPGPFLESLFTAWEYARKANARGKTPPSDVSIDQVYAVFTVMPGSAREYSKQEFARDLYLLEESGERTTKKGAMLHFSRSTGARQARGAATVVDRQGRRIIYSSISFAQPGS